MEAIKKKIRLRIRYLQNEYLKHEAEQINQLAINRELEKLFHRAKQQGKILKSLNHSCDPQKLIDHFKANFNPPVPSESTTPHELERENAPPEAWCNSRLKTLWKNKDPKMTQRNIEG